LPTKISGYNAPEPLTAPKGSSGPGAVADKSPADAPSAAAPAASTADQVTLTGSARTLQKLGDAIASTPVVNTAKVAAVKQAVQGGTYQVDPGKVADKIIQSERDLS
jgi:negative regulator of flagellin synthesis FlgM